MVKEREIYSYNDHSDRQELRNLIAQERAKEAAEEKLIEDELMDEVIGPSAYRLIEGNAFAGALGTAAQQARSVRKPSRKARRKTS